MPLNFINVGILLLLGVCLVEGQRGHINNFLRRQPALVVPPPPQQSEQRQTQPIEQAQVPTEPTFELDVLPSTNYGRNDANARRNVEALPATYYGRNDANRRHNVEAQPTTNYGRNDANRRHNVEAQPTTNYGRNDANARRARADEELSGRDKIVQDYGQLQKLDDNFEEANYDYKYQVHGGGNNFGHEESRRDYKTRGQYNVLLPDGRRQIVSYFADESGYHPTITYEFVGDSASAPQRNTPGPNLTPRSVNPPPRNGGNGGYRSKRQFRHGKRVVVKRVKVRRIPTTQTTPTQNKS